MEKFACIHVNTDCSENVQYNQYAFPVLARQGILSTYPNYEAISHWHDDIELIYVISGEMNYNINGNIVLLKPGNGLFVNSRQFHYGFSPEHTECIFICILFHTSLLSSSRLYQDTYITPLLKNECFPYLVLNEKTLHDNNIIALMKHLYEQQDSDFFPLIAQSVLPQIWEDLFLLANQVEKKQVPKNQYLSILKNMISFINTNYMNEIALKDISDAGKVGKTICCSIFKTYTNKTPFAYLTEYRLDKSCELLISTDKNIVEICYEVGFSSASYYSETFKKFYQCTPTYYRKNNFQK